MENPDRHKKMRPLDVPLVAKCLELQAGFSEFETHSGESDTLLSYTKFSKTTQMLATGFNTDK